MIILNKTDLVAGDKIMAVEGEVRDATERRVKLIRAGIGNVPSAEVLLGLGVGTENDMASRRSHHEIHHEDGHEHDHDHDEFESFVVEGGAVSDAKAMAAALIEVIEAHDVLRLKGFVEVSGKPMRMVVQAVGKRIDTYFDRDWTEGEARSSRLVVIGLHDMDKAAVTAAVKAALV